LCLYMESMLPLSGLPLPGEAARASAIADRDNKFT
jgi:hypothetical protein